MAAKVALFRATALSVVLVTSVGCWAPPQATSPELRQGVVWLFPGVEGGDWSLQEAYTGLREAGVERAIHVWDWDRLGGTLANLTDYPGNRARAAEVAHKLRAYRAENPEAPIDLVGYSGGAGIAVFVAEALPEDFRLRSIVLCHPALSPSYDLTAALKRVDESIVNFYSGADLFILGAGTATFGTMDRTYTPSAGLLGFEPTLAAPDAKLRVKLKQRAWKPAEQWLVHYGGHLPILSRNWNRYFVAPFLLLNADASPNP